MILLHIHETESENEEQREKDDDNMMDAWRKSGRIKQKIYRK